MLHCHSYFLSAWQHNFKSDSPFINYLCLSADPESMLLSISLSQTTSYARNWLLRTVLIHIRIDKITKTTEMWSHKYPSCRHLHYYMVFTLQHQRKEGSPAIACALGDEKGSSWWHLHVAAFTYHQNTVKYLLGQTWNHRWIRSNRKILFILFPGIVS